MTKFDLNGIHVHLSLQFLDTLGHDHIPDFINEDANEKIKLNVKRKKGSKMTSYFVVFKQVRNFDISLPVIFLSCALRVLFIINMIILILKQLLMATKPYY